MRTLKTIMKAIKEAFQVLFSICRRRKQM